MSAHSPAVASLSFSPDGAYLAWLSNDAQLRVWDGRRVHPALQLPGGRHIAVGESFIAIADDTSPVVRFVDPANIMLLPRICTGGPGSGPIVALTPPQAAISGSPDAPFNGLYALVHGSACGVRIRSYAGENVAAFNAGSVVFCAAFDASATKLAVGDNKGMIRVWDFLKHTPTCISVKAHKSFVSSLAFAADGAYLVSGGWDGKTEVWDLTEDRLAPSVNMRPDGKTRDKVYAVAVPYGVRDDRMVAAGGTGGAVRVWRTGEGHHNSSSDPEPIATHTTHSSSIYALSFSPDGRHVASGAGDGTVRLFGVPSKPVLLSNPSKELPDAKSYATYPGSDVEGLYQIQPMDVIIKGQRADRKLIFCPSNVVTLSCPICANPYDSVTRVPICSGACGHTFACRRCNDQLWDMDPRPKCPVCRVELVDVVPNYELLRILGAAKGTNSSYSSTAEEKRSPSSTTVSNAGGLSREDYITLPRLSWTEAPEMSYMSRHSCVIYTGRMDGEVVAIRIPSRAAAREQSNGSRMQMSETERHISCLKRLRGPHIAQFYGVSRTEAPDNRVIVVSELPTGGTLAKNMSSLREWGKTLPPDTALSLSLQLIKTLRFLHQSDTSAGWALSPDAIAMAMPIRTDWTVRHRVKLMELGGTISKSECSTDIERTFPSDYIGYMAPEMLDEDRSEAHSRESYFRKMCQSDMYSLGVVLWEISSGKRPFEGYRPAQVVAAVVGRGERPGFPPSGVPSELQTLISRLWSQEPTDRPTAEEACRLLETVPSAPPPM